MTWLGRSGKKGGGSLCGLVVVEGTPVCYFLEKLKRPMLGVEKRGRNGKKKGGLPGDGVKPDLGGEFFRQSEDRQML